ncbi:hypothetical protein QYE76_069969 [Lolium multiflorum]|uniref:Uncharacterized protein n=1 Tax=Lolium multiflorum TaxID=4521 RepID=A0AAD8SIB6_LOLMU|nr:hypothetical protein QYE76_069969 [Lolium multiflorum]
MCGLRLWGVLTGEVSCPPHATAPVPPTPPSVPQALAEDATQADRDAAKSAEATAEEAYEEQGDSSVDEFYTQSAAIWRQLDSLRSVVCEVLTELRAEETRLCGAGLLGTPSVLAARVPTAPAPLLPTQRLLLLEEPARLVVGVALALLGSALTVGGLVTLSLTAIRNSKVCLLVLHLQRMTLTLGHWLGLALGAVTPRDFGLDWLHVPSSTTSPTAPCPYTAESLTTFSSFAHQTSLSSLTTLSTLHTFLSQVTFLAYGASSLPFSLLTSSP